MLNKSATKNAGKILYLGLPAVSLLVTGFASYDPVNVGKMVLSVGIGFSLLALALRFGITHLNSHYRSTVLAAILFGLAGLFTSLFSAAPFVQNFYGVFGRNTGLLTYFGLIGIFVGSLLVTQKVIFEKIVKGLIVAGVLNVFFSALELSGTNIFGFNNIYGEILGTFGNPNFISSFLGIFISVMLAYTLGGNFNVWIKLFSVAIAIGAFYEVVTSKSIQGIVVTAIGLTYIGFLTIRSQMKNSGFQFAYLIGAATASGFAVAGALQIGPLTSLIYKGSVSLRGEYWRAGITAALDHPFTGVGFDNYGDWYRRTRSASAMIVPGPDTVTNSAHNVNIDIFSYGGFPVLIPYLFLLAAAAIAILRFIRRTKKYDPVFAAISVGWFCYQAQAIISINQIGLAVWGWALTGLVIAYEKISRVTDKELPQKPFEKIRMFSRDSSSSTYLIGVAGFAVGVAIAFPPFLADSTWRTAVRAGSAELVISAADKWPLDSYRQANIAVLLAQNNLDAQAAEIIRKAIAHNPDYFDAWKVLAGIPGSTPQEKIKAVAEMKRLDPRNKLIK
jgi:O-antigen ligase